MSPVPHFCVKDREGHRAVFDGLQEGAVLPGTFLVVLVYPLKHTLQCLTEGEGKTWSLSDLHLCLDPTY